MKGLRSEVTALSTLDSMNVVKFIAAKEEAKLIKSDTKTKKVSYVVEEKVSGADLFEYIYTIGALSEQDCRFFVR